MTATSRRELARALGKSEGAIRKWMKGGRWSFGQEGPWDIEAVRAWAKKTLTPDFAKAARRPSKAATKVRPKPAALNPASGSDAESADADVVQEDDDGLVEERKVNILLKRERTETQRLQRELMQFRHDVEQGKYLKREDVERFCAEGLLEFKTEMRSIPDAAVPGLQGLPELDQRSKLLSYIDDAFRHLADRWCNAGQPPKP